MKRVAKFQEGGDVEMTAAERRRQNIQRINQRRATNRMQAAERAEIERFNERLRQGTLTADDARRMSAEAPRPQMTAAEQRRATNREQAAVRSEIERFNERLRQGTLTADDMRRMGAEAPQRPAAPAPSMRDAVRPARPGEAPRRPADAMRDAVRPVGPSAGRPAPRGPGIAGAAGTLLALGPAAMEAYDAYRNRPITGEFERSMDPEGSNEAADAERERQASQRAAPAPAAAPRPAARESRAADDLNEIVMRLTRGEKPVTETEKRLADRMGIAYRKGGMVKPKTAMKKGGAVKAPAKKMKSGGKVAPKKMMKGGMTSKPKKMMGGGRAMYAKGGMAKGCK